VGRPAHHRRQFRRQKCSRAVAVIPTRDVAEHLWLEWGARERWRGALGWVETKPKGELTTKPSAASVYCHAALEALRHVRPLKGRAEGPCGGSNVAAVRVALVDEARIPERISKCSSGPADRLRPHRQRAADVWGTYT